MCDHVRVLCCQAHGVWMWGKFEFRLYGYKVGLILGSACLGREWYIFGEVVVVHVWGGSGRA